MNSSGKASKFAAFGIIALMLGMSALAWVPTGSAAGEVTWHFDSTNASGFTLPTGTHVADNFMSKTAPTTNDIGETVQIAIGAEAWFYADSQATAQLKFPDAGWTASLQTFTSSGVLGGTLTLTVYKIDSGGNPSIIASGSAAPSGSTALHATTAVTVTDDGGTSPTFNANVGDRLAVKIAFTATITPTSVTICYDDGHTTTFPDLSDQVTDDSTITSPSNSPDYPVPNFSTLVLMGSGMVVGVGMLAYSNKKKK
jgi:hypothetical protein